MSRTMTDIEIMNVALVAQKQLLASVPANVVMSWGVTQFSCCEFEGMATLIVVVNGFLHKGPVFISYNKGNDLYEVRTVKNHTKAVEVLMTADEVYCEDLGRVVDRLVEKDCSDEKYGEKVRESLLED